VARLYWGKKYPYTARQLFCYHKVQIDVLNT
jgi:hypothetical protein